MTSLTSTQWTWTSSFGADLIQMVCKMNSNGRAMAGIMAQMAILRLVCKEFNAFVIALLQSSTFYLECRIFAIREMDFETNRGRVDHLIRNGFAISCLEKPMARVQNALCQFVMASHSIPAKANLMETDLFKRAKLIVETRDLVSQAGPWRSWIGFAAVNGCHQPGEIRLTDGNWSYIFKKFHSAFDDVPSMDLSLLEQLLLVTGTSAEALGFQPSDLNWWSTVNKSLKEFLPELSACVYLSAYHRASDSADNADEENSDENLSDVLLEDRASWNSIEEKKYRLTKSWKINPEDVELVKTSVKSFKIAGSPWNWNVLDSLCQLFEEFNLKECQRATNHPLTATLNRLLVDCVEEDNHYGEPEGTYVREEVLGNMSPYEIDTFRECLRLQATRAAAQPLKVITALAVARCGVHLQIGSKWRTAGPDFDWNLVLPFGIQLQKRLEQIAPFQASGQPWVNKVMSNLNKIKSQVDKLNANLVIEPPLVEKNWIAF